MSAADHWDARGNWPANETHWADDAGRLGSPYIEDDTGAGEVGPEDYCHACGATICPPTCRHYVKPQPLEVTLARIRETQARIREAS